MQDFILKLFGIDAVQAGRVAHSGLTFHGVVSPLWIFLAALVLGVLVFITYWRTAEQISLFRKLLLSFLRFGFLLLILGILCGPVWSLTLEHSVRRTVLMLFDASASMSEIRDQRSDDDDRKRLAIARNLIDPAGSLKQPLPQDQQGLTGAPRIDVVKSALKNDALNLLPRLAKDFDLQAYSFGQENTVTEIADSSYRLIEPGEGDQAPAEQQDLSTAWVNALKADAPLSAVGDSIERLVSAKRGQMLAGIILVTDGASNAGLDPNDAAALAARNRVPLYIYGVGITAPKDIVVTGVVAPEVAFVDDEIAISATVSWRGMEKQSARLVVQLGDQRGEQDVDFESPEGEKLVTVRLTPKTKGQFKVTASIDPRPDEVVKDNNTATQDLRVIDDKIKVLYVEQYPRWEFKYVQAALARDRRVAAKFLLLEGDPSIARGPATPYISEFPGKEDLFKYDLVILGDVSPTALPPTFLESLDEFVSKFGGGVAVLAGKRFMPSAYRRTPLEKMLPVELESVDFSAGAAANQPVRLELTPQGKAHAMLRLADSDDASAAVWSRLPPVYWVHRVARAKPAAEVLVVDPDPARATRYGKMPVIALQQSMGQVLYVGTDNLWRMRRNAGDRYHAALWGQMVLRLAQPHLLGLSKRTQPKTDRKLYSTGQKMGISARLYTEGFAPVTDPVVKATLAERGGSGNSREILLRPMPGQPGMYQGEAVAGTPAQYALTIDHEKDPAHAWEFTIQPPRLELENAAMNKALLENMAKVSGGAFFREEDLHTLPDKIAGKNERIRTRVELELWSTPAYFLMMLALVSAEWILRKMSQLK